VGACARGVRDAVRAMRWTGISNLESRISNLESRISAPDGRGFDSFDSFVRSFVRLAVTLARSVGTMSRERRDGGTTGASDDDESMNVSNVSNERRFHYSYNGADRPTDRRPTIE
jgi:hypothetical protein